MDFTVLILGLILVVGIPIRNKAIKKYREIKGKKKGDYNKGS